MTNREAKQTQLTIEVYIVRSPELNAFTL